MKVHKIHKVMVKKTKKNEEINEDDIKSKKNKVVFVEIDDEVTQVYDNIKKCNEDHIILIIPKEAVIFQSIINFKILKKKEEDLAKTITIITKDKIGLYLGRQAGFTVGNDIDSTLQFKGIQNNDETMEVNEILSFTSNVSLKEHLKKLPFAKQSIFEILKNIRINNNSNGTIKNLLFPRLARPKLLSENKLKISIPNKRALFTLIFMSLAILIVSAYIILPGATLYITPKSNVISQSTNILLADNNKYDREIKISDQNIIGMYFYETDVIEEMKYKSTGKIFEGINATGKVTIYNVSSDPWPLIPKTRLQTSEGLVFRTQAYITVPPKEGDKNGSIEVSVIADEFDIYEETVGDRGNISPRKFFLPGLNESNQKLLYAESKENFTGGQTKFRYIVTEEDIFAAEELIKQKVMDNLKENLKKEITTLNKQHNTNFYLLLEEPAIKSDKLKITIPDNIVGSSLTEFDVNATMHVKAPYFNFNELLQILENELKKHTNLKKTLVKVYKENIQFDIVETNDKMDRLKLTATIQGLEEFNLDESSEEGKALKEKIIKNTAGKKVDEAANFIQNIPEVNKVEIEMWPKWAITIPSVAENIKIKIVNIED